MLEERADFSPIGTMPVTHREEVAVLKPHYVRVRYVGVLVHFVRVVCRDSTFCGKGKLGNDVNNF